MLKSWIAEASGLIEVSEVFELNEQTQELCVGDSRLVKFVSGVLTTRDFA